MERFQNRKTSLFNISMVLLALATTSIIFTVIQVSLNRTYTDALNYIQSQPLSNLVCFDLCQLYPNQAGSFCCDGFIKNCLLKQVCLNQTIAELQQLINTTSTWFIIFLIPSIVFLLSTIAIFCCIIKLRRQQSNMYNLQASFIIQNQNGDRKITDSFVTNDQAPCPICMMEYREQKIIKLRCNHKFHSSCIRKWNQTNSSCPVCRSDIYE